MSYCSKLCFHFIVPELSEKHFADEAGDLSDTSKQIQHQFSITLNRIRE